MNKGNLTVAIGISIVYAILLVLMYENKHAPYEEEERAIAPTSDYMVLPVVSVTDGDTIKTSLGKRLPAPLNNVSIRLRDVDTPELRGACEKEKHLAQQAKAEVSLIATGQQMRVYNYEWDKYGGRIVADVYVNGVTLSQHLITKGLAVPYTGEGPKRDWCQ